MLWCRSLLYNCNGGVVPVHTVKAYSGVACSCIHSLLWHVDGSGQRHAPASLSQYSRINSAKSPASDAGNVSEPRLVYQGGRVC